MKDTIPVVEPIKLKEYEFKQSKYSMVAKLPMRSVLLGPSGSGKTVLLVIFLQKKNDSIPLFPSSHLIRKPQPPYHEC